jgi:hypothetical protein
LTTALHTTAARHIGATAVMVILTLTLLTSCASRDTGPPRAAVERLMAALFARDAEAVAEVAPALVSDATGSGSDGVEEDGVGDLGDVFDALDGFSDWSIEEVSREGDSAVATVALTGDGRNSRIVVPLSLRDGEWVVDEEISVSTTLDFVPLE